MHTSEHTPENAPVPVSPVPSRMRWWAVLRPEEYLVLLVLAVFATLHLTGITTLVLKTSFIRAGWDLASVFLVVFAGLAGWQQVRSGRGLDPVVPAWAIALAVSLPIVAVGLLAARVLPFRWQSGHLVYAWAAVAAWLGFCGWTFVRESARKPDATGAGRAALRFLSGVARSMLVFARSWAPFIVLLAAYENALMLVARMNSDLHDPAIFGLDETLFGGHLDVWFQGIISPKVTELFAFFYDSLYLYPIIIGMTLFFQHRMREFRSFMLAFVLAGYVGFVGYVTVPVIGPAFYYPGIYEVDLATGAGRDHLAETAADGGEPAEAMSFYLLAQRLSSAESFGGHIPRNCFPSLHTGWGVILLVFSFLYLRKLFFVFAIPLLWLIAATSYLRYHYVTDVVAGTLLALSMALLVPMFEEVWERRGRKGPVVPPAEPRRRRLKKLAIGLAIPLAFYFFVLAWVYSYDSASQREVIAAQLGERFVGKEAPVLSADERVGAVFADSVELLGVQTSQATWKPGDLVELTFWWQCRKPLEGDWKVFVHVRGAGARTLSNLDHHPAFGAYPFRLWAAGDVVKDVVVMRVPAAPVGSTLSVWTGLFSERDVMRRAEVVLAPGTRRMQDQAVEAASVKLAR